MRYIPRTRHRVLIATALACLVEAFAPARPFGADLAGLWLVFAAPTAVWYGCAARVVSTKEAAAFVALSLGLTTDMAALLVLNELLPRLGDAHPLAQRPITATLAVTVILLGAVLPSADRGRADKGSVDENSADEGSVDKGSVYKAWAAPWRLSRAELAVVGGAGALCLVLSVAGPIRLNNGFGSHVSLAALTCTAALGVWLLARRGLSPAAAELGIYCAALALLLTTSLRGWSITGHDIQREYDYFQIAYGRERWDIRTFSNPYNACLSITLLPEAVAKLTAVSGVYVFKVIIPMLFAATPVMIYRATRNAASQQISVLAALFFIMFPTFFTDMPYEGRQEVAFVVLGSAILLVTERERGLRARRLAFMALMGGLVASHYSTTYVFVIVLAAAAGADLCWRAGTWAQSRRRAAKTSASARSGRVRRARPAPERERGLLAWWMVPVVAGLALLWAGPLTETGGQLKSTLTAAVQEISGVGGTQSGSSSISYSIFGGGSESDAQRLSDYGTQEAAASKAARAAGQLLPQSMVDKYSTPLAKSDELPLTGVGTSLEASGVDVASANTLLRNTAADLMQVLILVGLAAMWLRRRTGLDAMRDQVTLTFGALGMLAALTLIPQLSIDYSVLRGFQQGIFFFAPFMALGLVWMLSWLRRYALPGLCLVTAALILDLSGVVPRVTGGYPPQLSLSNSGQYYDIYDPTLSEQAAAAWLEGRIYSSKDPGQALIQTDFYTYFRLQTILNSKVYATVYPATLNRDAYVFLGTATVKKDEVTVFYDGDLVTYYYPTGLLNTAYNEIFASSGAEIYQ